MGFLLLLGYAIFRLGSIAIAAFSYQFYWYHWLVLGLNTLLMAYLEGYRGFQKGFSPRMTARARYLYQHPHLFYALLAPFYCIGYFQAPPKLIKRNIALTVMIIVFIGLIRLLAQPWRGILDVGVVVGLSWGAILLLIFTVQAFSSTKFDHSPEIPEALALN